jgi:N-acetylmuramoyl-L-alanine amidase
VKNYWLLSFVTSFSWVLFSGWAGANPAVARLSPIPGDTSAQSVLVAQNSTVTVIQAIDLDLNTGQLLIRTNQPALFNTGWDRTTGAYRIMVTAQPANGLRLPATGATSPLLRLETKQNADGTTTLLLYPASGVQIGQLQSISPEVNALPLSRGATALMPPSDSGIPQVPDRSSNPVYPPVTQPRPLPPRTVTPRPLPPRPLPPRPLPPVAAQPRSPIGARLVVIDPGHGGPDPGAVGIGGIQEKDIVLDVSHQVTRLLQAQGIQVVMTREDDRDLGLEPRTSLANSVGATAFLSIHANAVSLSRPEINGVETFHYLDSSYPLADSIQQSILDSTGMNSRGVKRARFYVLRYTRMPAALVEIGFVTGEQDAPRLADPSFRATMSQAIARGILRYLQGG